LPFADCPLPIALSPQPHTFAPLPLILSIDTALETASVAISKNDRMLAVRSNKSQLDHAAWIHEAIQELFTEADCELQQLAAIAVASGPGSYTGLRVGMATAKGLCYALNKPLITETTLMLTATRLKKIFDAGTCALPVLICPMIDARRMEVFTMLYNWSLQPVLAPHSLILSDKSFAHELETNNIVFCGNGMPKWKDICSHPHAVFSNNSHDISDLAEIALDKFKNSLFSELAYTEPDYFKNFYTGK
jgi:tRNA threonylcarbamoyladenosine biosynthesis protein TsaB